MDSQPTSGQTVAEAYLKSLKAHGIKHVFANGGTDFAPIVEALAYTDGASAEIPYFVTVPHENVAMAMAVGYYKASLQPAAVMVHVTVGTANALCGVMNADRGNVPVLLAAGRTPVTESGHHGSRNIGIHWSQENFDQGGMLREYVRWDYELRAGMPVNSVVGRAVDIAMTDPKGPVYLTLPREVLGDEAIAPGPEPRDRPIGAAPPAPSAASVEQAADILAAARRPLIIGGSATPQGFSALAELAEEYVFACAPGPGSYLPSSHGMNLGGVSGDLFDWADAVLVLDSPVPWIPRYMGPDPEAKLIHIAPDPHFARYPYRGYQMDLAITGSVDQALPLLHEALKGKGKGKDTDARRHEIADKRRAILENRAKVLEKAESQSPIAATWLAKCLNDIKDDDAIFFNELGVNGHFMDFDRPLCNMAGGGSAGGLGNSVGSAIGAKIACPDRQVITAVGDGSYMFNVPSACHFVQRAENLPTLTVIANNEQWFAVRRATTAMYPDGRASKANSLPVVDLTPSPDYSKIVEFCDGYGETVEDPAKLHGALERGLKAVDNGNPAVINVRTSAGGRD